MPRAWSSRGPGFSKPAAPLPASRPPLEQRVRQRSCHGGCGRFGCFAVQRAGRGPWRQLSCFGERAAIHGTQQKENTMSTKKHTIYVINTADNGKSYWNRGGVAFENREGGALPVRFAAA